MKRQILILVLFVLAISSHAQKSVTTFLGIPVDGTKSEMIRKLKNKGFKDNPYIKDGLTGEFNGREVNISIATNSKTLQIEFCLQRFEIRCPHVSVRFTDEEPIFRVFLL